MPRDPDLIELALELAEHGIPVFPCSANKKPAIPKDEGGRGFLDASTDPDTIERLFDRSNARLIGVPTGSTSGFDILDIDPRHEGHLWERENRDHLPETRIHKTLHGGHHWVFLHAPGVRSSQGKIAAGVDVRGDGGYACWPPSDGYTIASDADAVHWPDWLLKAALAASATRSRLAGDQPNGNGNGHGNGHNGHDAPQARTGGAIGEKRLNGYMRSVLTNVGKAPEGQKHFMLRNAAMALGGVMQQAGFSEREAVKWLLERLPPTVQDWKNAEDTAIWGLRAGRLAEIQLPDREPPPNIRLPGRKRRDPPPRRRDRRDDPEDDQPEPEERRPPLEPKPWVYIPPVKLQSREWLIGTYLLRDYVTLLGSPGGVGKTATALAFAFALMTGRHDILEKHVFQTGKVWYLTLEDDEIELQRRIDAGLLHHGIDGPGLMASGRFFLNCGDERPILLAERTSDGEFRIALHADELEQGILRLGILLVIIDPLVKSHRIIENSNEHMDQLAQLLNGIARRTRCAILLTHHFRKATAGQDGATRDAFRGGGSFVDALRIALILSQMTPKEAENFGIARDDASSHIRLDNAKANLAPAGGAIWFRLHGVALGNGGGLYPEGDNVQAVSRWVREPMTAGISRDMAITVIDRLREGLGGEPYTPHRRGRTSRWAGQVLMDFAGRTPDEAARILVAWEKNGIWRQGVYRNANNQDRPGVMINEAKVAELLQSYPSAAAHQA